MNPLLHHKIYGEGAPVVIIHGLFGSLDNWQTIAKTLSQHYMVVTIDLRNHGRSFHDDEMNFELINEDLHQLIDFLKIKSFHIMGHSLGGKIAMNFASRFPTFIKSLIVVDVAPYNYHPYHLAIFEALLKVPINTVTSRQEVEDSLKKYLDIPMEIQFLMKGLNRNEEGHYDWKFNLAVLHHHYLDLIQHIPIKSFLGPTLFIKGALSNYISIDKFENIPLLFPNYELEEIKNAGHWVHAENPNDFLKVIQEFLAKQV